MEPSSSTRLHQKATSRILCKYFMSGVCREKENCRFSHSFSDQPSMVCTFYKQGACSYGASCRYDHQKANSFLAAPKTLPLPMNLCVSTYPVQGHPASVPGISLLKTNVIPVTSHLVTLGKSRVSPALPETNELKVTGLPSKINADEWVKAAEFVPGQKWRALSGPLSYLEAVQSGMPRAPCGSVLPSQDLEKASAELCPYAVHGECPYGSNCSYIHGDVCELCGREVLVPFDELQNRRHAEECMREHEKSMEAAFAAQRSQDKVCGICMEVVWEKLPVTAQRFGILSDCTHVFCLACIRKWRAEDQYENEVIRACPECRVKSDFVIPSKYWVQTKEDKVHLIDTYKMALSQKPCMHFRHGNGECPFNNKCFYEHAYPDGRKASPQPVRRRQNADGEVDVVHEPSLWGFLSAANERRMELGNFLLAENNDEELLDLTSLGLI